MRKWMRDRLKRRKQKSQEDSKPQTTQAPLQPAYFDAAAPSSEVPENRAAESNEQDAEQAPVQAAQAPAQGGNGEGRPRRRRRRGRGGRGRRGAVATSQAPPAPLQPTLPGPEVPVSPAREKAADQKAEKREAIPVAPRTPKGVVTLAIGLPGSGKSSWFKRHNITPLSSDLLRGLLFDDPTEQRFQDLVFSNLRSMLRARLIARRPMSYVDATNLSPQERRTWIKMAHDYGYEVQGVFFDVPVEVCMERNQRRARVVAEDVMRRMAGKLRPPTFEEGFAKITVVRVKKKN